MRRRILGSFAYGPAAFVAAQQARAQLRRQLLQLFNQVDVISTPTQPDAAPSLNTIGWTLFTNPFNLLGWPAISIPCGLTTDGMPLGLQLVGTPWDEATVLRGARVVEAAINIGHPGEK
jgi:aspartyl-tRNA(Asn)/glutamyl-tRNA(Gln) amidotransferase subunit A